MKLKSKQPEVKKSKLPKPLLYEPNTFQIHTNPIERVTNRDISLDLYNSIVAANKQLVQRISLLQEELGRNEASIKNIRHRIMTTITNKLWNLTVNQ